jgi:hypothetical protein
MVSALMLALMAVAISVVMAGLVRPQSCPSALLKVAQAGSDEAMRRENAYKTWHEMGLAYASALPASYSGRVIFVCAPMEGAEKTRLELIIEGLKSALPKSASLHLYHSNDLRNRQIGSACLRKIVKATRSGEWILFDASLAEVIDAPPTVDDFFLEDRDSLPNIVVCPNSNLSVLRWMIEKRYISKAIAAMEPRGWQIYDLNNLPQSTEVLPDSFLSEE